MRENQALLRSFDAVVNRLQAALDAKDAAAAALRLDLEALDDVNAKLSARLDRALAPPPLGMDRGKGSDRGGEGEGKRVREWIDIFSERHIDREL